MKFLWKIFVQKKKKSYLLNPHHMRWNCNWTLAIYALQGLVGSLGYYLLLQNIPGKTLRICKKKKIVSNLYLLGHLRKKKISSILRTLIKCKFFVIIALCKTQRRQYNYPFNDKDRYVFWNISFLISEKTESICVASFTNTFIILH